MAAKKTTAKGAGGETAKKKPLKFEVGFADKALTAAEWKRLMLQMRGDAAPGDAYRDAAERVAEEAIRRDRMLYEYYGITRDGPVAVERLVVALANDLFPGFDVHMPVPRRNPEEKSKQPPGRPKEEIYGEALVQAVAEVDSKHGRGIAHACDVLSKRKGPYFGKDVLTLQRRFSEGLAEMREAGSLWQIRRLMSGN